MKKIAHGILLYTYKTYVTTPKLLRKRDEKEKTQSYQNFISSYTIFKTMPSRQGMRIIRRIQLSYHKSLAVDTGFIRITSGANNKEQQNYILDKIKFYAINRNVSRLFFSENLVI